MLTSILLVVAQFCMMEMILAVYCLPYPINIMSSANALTLFKPRDPSSSRMRSLMYRLNSIGEIRLPWGVPLLKNICSFPMFSVMFEKRSLIMLIVSESIFACSSLLNRS